MLLCLGYFDLTQTVINTECGDLIIRTTTTREFFMKPPPSILLVLILLLIALISKVEPLIAMENLTLEGNVYSTKLNGENNILTFRAGSFQSSLYAERGYDKGKYTTVIKGDSILFEARTLSPHDGEILWSGVVEGNSIKGSYLYTKKGWFLFGDITRKKNFNGSLRIK
jgi:hypothetical protein